MQNLDHVYSLAPDEKAYVAGVGHCAFTTQQFLAALAAVESWLDTGVKPDAAAFPETLGFDNTFSPPPWPYY